MRKMISAIVPALNEEGRISRVLKTLISSNLFSEIIVVDDASTDATLQEVKTNFPAVKILHKEQSTGKGDALLFGVKAARGEILLFCDADLINLHKKHLELLIHPVVNKKLRMAVGVQEYMSTYKAGGVYRFIKFIFNNFGGDGRPYFNNFLKSLGGERVLYRSDFLKIKEVQGSSYGIERRIEAYFIKKKLKFNYFVLKNVHHVHKLKKWGIINGFLKEADFIYKVYFDFFDNKLINKNNR